jgi:hypothetical protein
MGSQGGLKGERLMRGVTKILSVLVLGVSITPTARPAAAGNGPEAFDKLKSLVGHWEAQPAGDAKAAMDIQLTGQGSAVMETSHTVEGGKPVEMVTMYYLDGGQLKMTHYCMAGNQPTMQATYTRETKTLTFDFLGATNLKSPNDGHMHHAVYTFQDNDHLKTVWTFQKDQKDAFVEEVTYVRK